MSPTTTSSRLALTEHELDLARTVCTSRQWQVVDCRRRGWSYRRIGLYLDVTEATVRGHLEAAERRIVRAFREQG